VCKISMWIVKYITALVLMIEVANSHTFLGKFCIQLKIVCINIINNNKKQTIDHFLIFFNF
jgi:hypothetical protein